MPGSDGGSLGAGWSASSVTTHAAAVSRPSSRRRTKYCISPDWPAGVPGTAIDQQDGPPGHQAASPDLAMHCTADTENGDFIDDPTAAPGRGPDHGPGRAAADLHQQSAPRDETRDWYASVSLPARRHHRVEHGDPDFRNTALSLPFNLRVRARALSVRFLFWWSSPTS